MRMICTRCGLAFKPCLDTRFFFMSCDRKGKREFLDSVVCETCGENARATLTVAGALCLSSTTYLRQKTENVSRETSYNGEK